MNDETEIYNFLHKDITEIKQILRGISSGIGWACVWLFLILIYSCVGLI